MPGIDDPDGDGADDVATSRTKTFNDNPALTCTVEQLAFAAWQRAAGASNLMESGPSWERFSAWWSAHATEFKTIRDVCAMAWAESSAHALDEWWRGIVASQPSRT
jgi:hypothetical protein